MCSFVDEPSIRKWGRAEFTIRNRAEHIMGLVFAEWDCLAAGKGEFAAILAETGIPARSMGDMVRPEVKVRGIPEAPTFLAR